MSNKTQLQTNNAELQDILNIIAALPNLADAQQGAYVWKKLTAEGGDFVDFVVNDTETAYPDSGIQDGDWYEKFNPVTLIANNIRKDVDIWGIVGTLVEGKAGIDFGTVTLSSSQSRVTVTHNLGKKPSFFLILIPNDQESMRMGYYWNYYGYDHEGLSRQLYYTIPTGDTSTSNTLTFYDLDRNNTYYWFAIA